MENRYHLDNGIDMIEFPPTFEGLEKAKEFRKNHPEFKGRKIQKVLQAYPSRIPLETPIRLTLGLNGYPIMEESNLTVVTDWEVWEYFDVSGNEEDGYDMNDKRCINYHCILSLPIQTMNPGTAQSFKTATPTDDQIKEMFNLKATTKISTDGDDVRIEVEQEEDGFPIGFIYCTSHDSLSPIRENKNWKFL